MNAADMRRGIPVGWTGDTRVLVGLLAECGILDAPESSLDEIAVRADAFLASKTAGERGSRELKCDLSSTDWKTRALAAARLSDDGAWTHWSVAGSLGVNGTDDERRADDALLSSAIAVAARETLAADIDDRQGYLRGPASVALLHEKDGGHLWDTVARPLVSEFAANARLHGAHRRSSALKAIAAAAHLKGQAMSHGAGEAPFLLGAAASSLLRGKPKLRTEGDASFMEELVLAVASLNGAREAMWDGADSETSRLMGAASASAALGTGSVSKPVARRSGATVAPAHLPPETIGRYAHLTASEAAEAIDDEAADPRQAEDKRRRLETISDALRRHPAAHAVSCAEALGMEVPEARMAPMRPGMKVYRAVMDGRRRPVVHEGKNGRAVRCRAVAGDDGALVGHLAFDALSREFGGRPLYAAYAHDGSRYGYAWADERPVIRRGEPSQGFMTAPASIDI
ncbi:MAG: hypothetical protein AAB554_05730 [Patescibacteria group bacterium]|mgnify:CR=1 FL=1